jgi:hypothetical protein
MEGKLQRKHIKDFSGGSQSTTTENLSGSNQLLHLLNGDCDRKIGGIVGRKGSNMISGGAVAAYRILNLFVYKYLTTKTYIAVLDNGTNVKTYKSSGADFAGTWSSVKDLTTGKESFWENFIGKAFYFNGQDTPQSTSDFSSFANVTNAPAAGKFPFVLNQALHVVTESGFLWSSDVVDSTGLAFTSTTWTSRGINPNDGQKVKYALRHRGRAVILKEESIYRYDGANEPEAIITVGTHSWRSVVIGADGRLYFHHPTGIYELDTGLPTPISRPVEKYLRGMNSANWDYVASARDEKNIYEWIGDVTINDPLEWDFGRTYTDVVLVFNVYTRRWTVYTGWNIRTGFFDDTTNKTYFGTNVGKIFEMNVNYVDKDSSTETPISMEAMIHPETWGFPERRKKFGLVAAVGKLQAQLKAAPRGEDILTDKALSAEVKNDLAEITSKPECRELWVYYAESYKDTPPFLKEIIIDRVELYDDGK